MNTNCYRFKEALKQSSDSSMVDEYGVPFYTSEDMKQVQIPLWSMNTLKVKPIISIPSLVQIPLWSMNTNEKEIISYFSMRSDSSMVDEYTQQGLMEVSLRLVQIPLWSMNTYRFTPKEATMVSSDSSMVDEYHMAAQ